ncbi:MAG: uroporphyrinogen-III synthase [Niabella sp.]|nr:uroporphyrinogen-III synthase [Niabella sp.]
MAAKPLHILSTGLLEEELIKSVEGQVHLDCIPFIKILYVAPDTIASAVAAAGSNLRYVIFTSKNAVKAVAAANLPHSDWNVFCIETATQKQVGASFPQSVIIATAPNGAQLAEKIVAHAPERTLFFCGNRRLNTIPETLARHHIPNKEITVYDTIETPKTVNKDYDGILFYSPSGVESFFSVNRLPQQTAAISIGPSTTRTLKKYTDKIIESPVPDAKQLVQQALLLR